MTYLKTSFHDQYNISSLDLWENVFKILLVLDGFGFDLYI